MTLRTPSILGNQVRFRARPHGAREASREIEQRIRELDRTAP